MVSSSYLLITFGRFLWQYSQVYDNILHTCVVRSFCSQLNPTSPFNIYKIIFNEMCTLAVISITIPVSSAAWERILSCISWLKNYMRIKVWNEIREIIMYLYMEKKMSKTFDFVSLLKDFSKKKNSFILMLTFIKR